MASWRQVVAIWAAAALAAAALSKEELKAELAVGYCGGDGRQDCLGDGDVDDLAFLQHRPRREVTTATADEVRFICRHYEVCQCESGPVENSTTCKPGTCRYDRKFSSWNYCNNRAPQCTDWSSWPSWKSCQWANFGDTGQFPGEGDIFMALPKRSLSPELLSSLASVTVFTDMDDTLSCSGGGMGGVDANCEGTKAGKMYPGVAEFELAITHGPSGKLHPQLVVPLSARPRQLKGLLRIKADSPENKAFKKLGGPAWGFDVDHALYGKLQDFMDIMADKLGRGGLTPFLGMGYTKFKGWNRATTSTGTSVFIGDDGQGDLVAAQMMLKSGKLLAAFIHDVKGQCREEACRAMWAEYGVFFFNDYVEAARIALAQGLISQQSCQQVCQAKGAQVFTCGC